MAMTDVDVSVRICGAIGIDRSGVSMGRECAGEGAAGGYIRAMRMLLAVIAGTVLGCGTPSSAPKGPGPVGTTREVATAGAIEGEPIAIGEARFGDYAAIVHTGGIAIAIDAAGLARHNGSPVFTSEIDRVLPFSEAVEDVKFVAPYAVPRNGPSPRHGRLFCARTRTQQLECVAELDATLTEPRRATRFRMAAGPVSQIGAAAAPAQYLGVLCARAEDGTRCWGWDHEATRAEPYGLEVRAAELATLELRPELAAAWRQEALLLSGEHVREVVTSESSDDGRIVGRGVDLTVQCARFDSGELSCFGPGVYGELGDGKLKTTVRASRPLAGLKVVDVAMLRRRVCAVVADGRVACWGAVPEDIPLPRIAVALPGRPSLCIVRRGGTLSCVE